MNEINLAYFYDIPMRPTAFIDLSYMEDSKLVTCTVHERKVNPHSSVTVARYKGSILEICYQHIKRIDKFTNRTQDVWESWSMNRNSRWLQNEEEMLCWKVLLASDVFCAGQAKADFAEAIKYPFWNEILEEMKRLQVVSSVMFS